MKTPLSPKVVAAAVAGFVIMALTGAVSLLEPSAFEALGLWGPVVFTGVTTGAAAVAGWWKTDPLRVNPQTLKDAPYHVVVKNPEAPPSNTGML